MPTEPLFRRLRQALGERAVRTDDAFRLDHAHDATFLHRLPDAVVSVQSTEQVQTVLKLANDERVPVVTRGGGSSLAGGSTPVTGGIVLVLSGMNRILEIDRANGVAVVEPGVITADLQQSVEKEGLFYPPDPASAAFATIGGNIATNAGGMRGVKYGVTRDYVRGLTVALADGSLLRLGGKVHKNSTGYQLLHLFVGSEGTLGVVTQAVLRLIPLPRHRRTARALFSSLDDASAAVTALLDTGSLPVALEIMDRHSLEAVHEHLGFPLPARAQAMLLVEADGSDEYAVISEIETMTQALAQCRPLLVQTARDAAERDAMWKARRSVSNALSKLAPYRLGEDVVVPRAHLPEMVRRAQAIGKQHGLLIAVFGHAGDGNLHPSILCDLNKPGEIDRLEAAAAAIFRAALDLGGQLSGEHGLGALKREFLEEAVGVETLAYMRAIKAAFDPNGILNPQKVFPTGALTAGGTGFLSSLPINKAARGE